MSPNEKQLRDAPEYLESHPELSIRAVAKAFSISPDTLRRRSQGGKQRVDSHAQQQRLTSNQEDWLADWILRQERAGFAPTHGKVRSIAQAIVHLPLLRQAEYNNLEQQPLPPIGKNWLQGFRRRHPEIHSLKSRKLDGKRAENKRQEVAQYFDLLTTWIDEFSVTPSNIWNIDEVGIAMGCLDNNHSVLGSSASSSTVIKSPETREWVSIIECISAAGQNIHPTVIFKGDYIMESWLVDSAPSDWFITTSARGWTSDHTGFLWLRDSFIPQTSPSNNNEWRLLICDGHGSHETESFSYLAHLAKIKVIVMPAHLSHVLQPLDLVMFSALKRRYRDYVRNNITELNFEQPIAKSRFLDFFKAARSETFTSSNARSAFRAAGIHPRDPQRILNQEQFTVVQPPEQPPEQADEQADEITPPNTAVLIDPAIISTPTGPRHLEQMHALHKTAEQQSRIIEKCIKTLGQLDTELI